MCARAHVLCLALWVLFAHRRNYHDYPLTGAQSVRSAVNGAGLIQLHFAYIIVFNFARTYERIADWVIDTSLISESVVQILELSRTNGWRECECRAVFVYRVREHFVSAQMLLAKFLCRMSPRMLWWRRRRQQPILLHIKRFVWRQRGSCECLCNKRINIIINTFRHAFCDRFCFERRERQRERRKALNIV